MLDALDSTSGTTATTGTYSERDACYSAAFMHLPILELVLHLSSLATFSRSVVGYRHTCCHVLFMAGFPWFGVELYVFNTAAHAASKSTVQLELRKLPNSNS